jgi:predicted Zn-dependent protease
MIGKMFVPAMLLLLISGHASAGLLDNIQKGFDMLSTSSDATQKAARPISDEEEYFLGRAVAARILETYQLLKDPKLTEYVNSIGMVLALHSEKPYTHGGYHVAILDTDEMNAFACPGGTIFITRGMLKAVTNEDELLRSRNRAGQRQQPSSVRRPPRTTGRRNCRSSQAFSKVLSTILSKPLS